MNIKALSMFAMLFLGVSITAQAYTIDGGATDVGLEDTLLTTAHLSNSGTENERLWVEGYLGYAITYLTKEQNLGYTIVDQGGTIGAFELQSSADYFLIKDGKVKQSDPDKKTQHALFENNASLDWGVVDFFAIFGDKWENLTISHVSEFNGKVVVSEPGSIALFLIALTGLGLARRHRKA